MNMQQFQERISKIVEDANNYKFKTNKPLEIFSEGKNSKLAAKVSILNLPPIATCPNCATCAGTCYATLRYGDRTHVQPRWDRNLAETKREDFVEACFGALNELGIKNVSDMSRASLNALIRAIKRFADMDEQNKETGYKLIKVFTDMISDSFNVKINETKEVIHDTLFNKKRGSK